MLNAKSSKSGEKDKDSSWLEPNFLKEDLKEFEDVKTWLRTVSKSTRGGYLNSLKKFCNWSGKDPHKLIMNRDEEKNISDSNKRNRTGALILDFREHPEDEGYAPSSMNTMDGGVR